MNTLLRTISLCIVSCILSLSPSSKSVTSPEIEKYRETALRAVIEKEKTTDHALNDLYLYPWSDNIEDDIFTLRTLVNHEKDIYCYQFYATDRIRVWIGTVFIRTANGELLDVSVDYLFTSGVTPFMSLRAGISKDMIKFDLWGEFTVIQRTTDFGGSVRESF